MKAHLAFLVLAILWTTSACSVFRPKHKTVEMDEDEWIVTDATQRVVFNSQVGNRSAILGRVDPDRIVCAEPSPDVANAISNAIQGALQAEIKGNSGQAQFSSSTTEAVAQLGERLATIQLLRDELADLCRSYANGSISATSYTIRLSRLDSKMVTLLMGEMTAGAFGRRLATISGDAGASSRRNASDEEIQKARNDLAEARENVSEKKSALDAIPNDDANKDARAKAEQNYKEALTDFQAKSELLIAALRLSAATFASSEAGTNAGVIGGSSESDRREVARNLVELQRAYLDDGDLGTLLAACISTLDVLFIPGEKSGAVKSFDDRQTQLIAELKAERNRYEERALEAQTSAKKIRVEVRNLTEEIDGLEEELNRIIFQLTGADIEGLQQQSTADDQKESELRFQKENLERQIQSAKRYRQDLEQEFVDFDGAVTTNLTLAGRREEEIASYEGTIGLQTDFGRWCTMNLNEVALAVYKQYDSVYRLRELQSRRQFEAQKLELCAEIWKRPDHEHTPQAAITFCQTLAGGVAPPQEQLPSVVPQGAETH